jgi:hypothetical protein
MRIFLNLNLYFINKISDFNKVTLVERTRYKASSCLANFSCEVIIMVIIKFFCVITSLVTAISMGYLQFTAIRKSVTIRVIPNTVRNLEKSNILSYI